MRVTAQPIEFGNNGNGAFLAARFLQSSGKLRALSKRISTLAGFNLCESSGYLKAVCCRKASQGVLLCCKPEAGFCLLPGTNAIIGHYRLRWHAKPLFGNTVNVRLIVYTNIENA